MDERGFLISELASPLLEATRDAELGAVFVAVTSPTIPLPSAKEIATQIQRDTKSLGHEYFVQNASHQITTFQDDEIQAELDP